MTRIEMVKAASSIVVLSAGKTVEMDSPPGSVGDNGWLFKTHYLKHETSSLLGRGLWCGGGGGNTAKCQYLRW